VTTLTAELTEHQQALMTCTMPEALDATSTRWPDRLAIHMVDTGEELTWAQLREHVSRLRSGLEALGVKPGDAIGIMLTNRIEWPITWLAAIEAGAVVVPVNPKYTTREIDFVLTDTNATWLVAAADLLEGHLADGKVGPVDTDHLIVVGEWAPEGTHDLAQARAHEITERRHKADRLDVVNIQFTSGTTGLPKGCVLTHCYWLHLGAWSAAVFGGAQRTLADHPFYYMQNQGYLAGAMASGGAIYVTHGLSRRRFMRWLVDYQIDSAWIDEDMLHLAEDWTPDDLALKIAPVSAIAKDLHRPLEERFGLKAREFYASTEIGGGTAVPVDRDDLTGTGSMGFAWPGRETKIIGEDLAELAPGQTGELCVRGEAMMLRYHNRPEANAELFLEGGWFRTGDLVRKDADGQHFYLGRLKDIVRRSGENIAAAEVEMHITAMPGIYDAGVIAVPDPVRDEEVKAIIVLEPGIELTAEQIVAWCHAGLAPFKVPRYIEFRDELPYTPSGKVRKATLKEEAPFGPGVIDTRPAA
jgi:acyl-CoA synthetase (AMP-forming)/AMP-acid ligase II